MNAIETSSLTKYYGKYRGIAEVTFTVPRGEIFGFIGPNGAGKSTTIRTLLNFIHPTGGSARIFGMDVVKDSAKIKREIGYLPGEVHYYDDMKVRDLLYYSASFYGRDCSVRIKELVSFLEVDMNKRIDSLSLGNKKKVAIIQSLLHQPGLLILDEPTSGLDPLMQNRFFELLEEENKRGVTIFFSSHILSEVQRMCDTVAFIKEGSILKIERIETLRANTLKMVKVVLKASEPGMDFNLPGVTNLRIKNNVCEFLYNGNVDMLIRKLSERTVENLWMEEPSLEEIFINYYEKEGK